MTFQIGFLLFPNVTQLDFTGPLQVLHRLPGSQTYIIAATLDPVPSDCGLSLVPTATYETCPQLDLICVPGGFGIDSAMADPVFMDFLKTQAARARYITSVCTGALVLGAAGLLKGRRATTHWAYHHLLETTGAIPVNARVVRDGNVITGGGVTAGIDFGFTVAAELAGGDVARAIQLGIEYDPAPPFSGGHPTVASPQTLDGLTRFYQPRVAACGDALAAAYSLFG
jgi:cyclohexyl-isocyanide hydratase